MIVPVFNYFVVDYFATGEGRTIFIMIDRNYDTSRSIECFKEWVGSFYFESVEIYSEKNFMKRYHSLLPQTVKNTIEKKNISGFVFQQKYHFNYS